MAEPLDLKALGIPGNRNPVRVNETLTAVAPFTQGAADLEIGPRGSVVPTGNGTENPQTRTQTQEQQSNDAADKHVRSRIGRRFRSF